MPEKQELLKRHLQQIAPTDATEGLEAVSETPTFHRHIEQANASDREKEDASAALGKLRTGEDLSSEETFALEAIILPGERPVIDIRGGTFKKSPQPFENFEQAAIKERIEKALPSVGRIELPGSPQIPFGGTGFVVGKNLVMTNRHVAQLFAMGLGRDGVHFQAGQSAGIDFKRERQRDRAKILTVARIVMIHPYWDMALLEVEGLGDEHPALRLASEDPAAFEGNDVAIIGYPAFDPRNDARLQHRIFNRKYNVKRLQPGKVMGRGRIRSYGSMVDALKHDASTLGGNSGSAVLHVDSGQIIALHFAGRYLDANFAVPTFELAHDRRVVATKLEFEPSASPGPISWEDKWRSADPPTVDERTGDTQPPATAPALDVSLPAAGQTATFTIPIEISFRVGAAAQARVGGDLPSADTASDTAVEKAVEPFHDDSYDGRQGFDENFLGIRLKMPTVTDPDLVSKLDNGEHEIPYDHFSLAMHKERRLALFTAANIDSRPERKKPEPGHKYTRRGLSGLGENDHEKWFLDPRIPGIHQLPDKFFTKDRKSFDKGHLVRRDDVAWGSTFDEVRRANGDTYHVTNCSPQVANFNRSNKPDGIWGKLENLILKQAKTEKLCVFGGPVLDDDDRVFPGVDDFGNVEVKIPSRYWKLVVARKGNRLESFAFLLEQNLDDVSWEEALSDVEFAVSAVWQDRMLAVADLEELIGTLRFPESVHNADQFDTDVGESVRSN